MDGRDDRQVEKSRNWTGTESLLNPIHRELSVNTTGVSGYNRRSSERKCRRERKERKDRNKTYKAIAGPNAYASVKPCVRILYVGGTPKRLFQHRCVCIQSFYAYASVVLSIYK
ncbi:hypothetical protein PIB30_032990 [Stylosanthes scabra]|uniref:Uncharacterized protein n=1 Tax=Stylosanthes scabra TaxID=79078 RepID=A0ABU6TE89_9FABA|nr:hypothetical protein [Stylosanthes scabra]